MADLSPVETLRSAAELLRKPPSDPWWWSGALVHPGIAEPLADWLDDTAADFETERRTEPATSSEEYALRVTRVLLGVPDGR